MNEKEKMLSGKIYDGSDTSLSLAREQAHKLCVLYNNIALDSDKQKAKIIAQLIPQNNGVYLQGPIYFDYGFNTSFGQGCYVNFNLTVLDVCKVTIGSNCFFGPNISLLTPMHPLLADERKMYKNDKGIMTDKEYAKPITIKDNCWLAANVTVCGGVTIGEGSVVGAGSVVTKDIPSNVLAFGNPCKVIRKITKSDSIYLKKELF